MFDSEIIQVMSQNPEDDAKTLAKNILSESLKKINADDQRPFYKKLEDVLDNKDGRFSDDEVAMTRLTFRHYEKGRTGGKPDDMTVIVGIVKEFDLSP